MYFRSLMTAGRTTNGTTKVILPGDQGCRARAVRTPVLRSLLTRCAKRFAGLSCVWMICKKGRMLPFDMHHRSTLFYTHSSRWSSRLRRITFGLYCCLQRRRFRGRFPPQLEGDFGQAAVGLSYPFEQVLSFVFSHVTPGFLCVSQRRRSKVYVVSGNGTLELPNCEAVGIDANRASLPKGDWDRRRQHPRELLHRARHPD